MQAWPSAGGPGRGDPAGSVLTGAPLTSGQGAKVLGTVRPEGTEEEEGGVLSDPLCSLRGLHGEGPAVGNLSSRGFRTPRSGLQSLSAPLCTVLWDPLPVHPLRVAADQP